MAGFDSLGLNFPSVGTGIGKFAVYLAVMAVIGAVAYFVLMWLVVYKYKIRIRDSTGSRVIVDKGRKKREKGVAWLTILKSKEKILFPVNAAYKEGKKWCIDMYRTEAHDLIPCKFYHKPPTKEELENIKLPGRDKAGNWEWKKMPFIGETKDGKLNVHLEYLFPAVKPDNIKVRQLHILKQSDIKTRFEKSPLWQQILPYVLPIVTVVICFLMFIITVRKCT